MLAFKSNPPFLFIKEFRVRMKVLKKYVLVFEISLLVLVIGIRLHGWVWVSFLQSMVSSQPNERVKFLSSEV